MTVSGRLQQSKCRRHGRDRETLRGGQGVKPSVTPELAGGALQVILPQQTGSPLGGPSWPSQWKLQKGHELMLR